jgi:PKD repeat protein
MQAEPAFVPAGQAITVTLTLSNPGQLTIDNLILSTTLPLDLLSYDSFFGPVIPTHDPTTNLLTFNLSTCQPANPPTCNPVLGYRGHISQTAPASALTLSAEILTPTVLSPQAQTSLIIVPAPTPEPTPTPYPRVTPEPPGPPATIQLAMSNEQLTKATGPIQSEIVNRKSEIVNWLAISVVDAEGRAVADDTEVSLSVQGGQVEDDRPRTKDGVATTQLKAPPGQVVVISAQAGSAQATLQWPEPGRDRVEYSQALLAHLLKRPDQGYDLESEAIRQARNYLNASGDRRYADNRSRQVEFSPTGLVYRLKHQASPAERVVSGQSLAGSGQSVAASLEFRLTGLQVGSEKLLTGQPDLASSGNWALYHQPDQAWQMLYEVGETTVEQYFILEPGFPSEADLIIEGQFQTSLQPILLSDEEGLRFDPVGNQGNGRNEGNGTGAGVEALAGESSAELSLAYGPAVAVDANGERRYAHLELEGKRLRLTIPGRWLERAEFPVVIDPVIGPANEVSTSQGNTHKPVAAYNPDDDEFLTVWHWNENIYGQRLEADGDLAGELITINQAEGNQHRSEVIYNPVSDEYLALWLDDRYGTPYRAIYGQRLEQDGSLAGSEILVAPPADNLGISEGEISAAVANSGAVLVVWSHDGGSTDDDIFGQMLDATGAISGTILSISTASNHQRYPKVVYDSASASFMVVWADKRSGGVYDLYGQRLSATGSLIGGNTLLVDRTSKDVLGPAAASTNAGQALVSWHEETSSSNFDVLAQRLITTTTGLTTSGGILPLDDTVSSGKDRHPAVTAISSSQYLVVWEEDGSKISYRQVDTGGVTTTATVQIDTGFEPALAYGNGQSLGVWENRATAGQSLIVGKLITSTAGSMLYISPYYTLREHVALTYHSQNNRYLLAWDQAHDSPTEDIFVQQVDRDGQPLGSELNITDEPDSIQEHPSLAAGSTSFLVAWQDERNLATTGQDLYGHLLDSSGVLSGTLITLTVATDDQEYPAVAYNSQHDNYLVAWHDYRNEATSNADIYAQIVGSNGVLQLTNPISMVVSNLQQKAAAAYNPDADLYLLVWEDKRPGTNSTDIYGQLVNAAGVLTGGTSSGFIVSNASNTQTDPAVAYNPVEQVFVVTWQDNRNSSQRDIYGQVVSGTAASLVGGNFAIASPSGSSNHQEQPAIASRTGDAVEELAVVWEDRRNSSFRDIYLQRVDGSGALLDETDTLTAETSPTVNLPIAVDSSQYFERPAIVYNPTDKLYLIAWNNQEDGGIYVQRYSSTTLPLPGASFSVTPNQGIIPLTVVFSDTSTGTIASRVLAYGDGGLATSTGPLNLEHTYWSTGAFTAILTTTNPSGSSVATSTITVSPLLTPTLDEEFESWEIEDDPTLWLDQHTDTTGRDDFKVWFVDNTLALGATYSGSAIVYSTYAIPDWSVWQDYEYSGRLWLTDTAGEVGATIYSRYPANEQERYVLRSEDSSGHFVLEGGDLPSAVDTGVTIQANTWFRFRILVETLADRVRLKAKVWPHSQSEPTTWQATAEDTGAGRISAGAVGLRTWGAGQKYADDLLVTSVAPDFSATPLSGTAPLTVTFTNSSLGANTYLWSFGDGSSFIIPDSSFVYTYTLPGVYTVTLTAGSGELTRTLTRTHYITVTELITRNWSLITPTTSLSPTVWGEHALAYDSVRGRVILYGGNATGWPYETTTWELSGSQWLTTTTSGPTARYGMEMAYDGAQVILFGGSSPSDVALNQTWAYTNAVWSQPTLTSTVPASRTYPSLAANPISGTLYLFGGNDSTTAFNDLWRYQAGSWSQLSPPNPKPEARSLAGLTYDPDQNRLLLFGGRTISGTILADLWAYNLAANSWTLLDGGGGGGDPAARMAHSLTYDLAASRAVLVGGVASDGESLLSGTWHYQGGWIVANPATAIPARAYHKAVYTDDAIILFSNREGWKYE